MLQFRCNIKGCGIVAYGEILAELRKDKGLTQEEVAKLIGVKTTTISSYEIGQNYPTVSNLIKLSELYNVNCDFLLDLTRYRLSWDFATQGIDVKNGKVKLDDLFALFTSLNLENREIALHIMKALKIEQKAIKKKSE